jgi:hypothetical protein
MKRESWPLLLALCVLLLTGSFAPAGEETGSLRFDRISVATLLPMLADQYGLGGSEEPDASLDSR